MHTMAYSHVATTNQRHSRIAELPHLAKQVMAQTAYTLYVDHDLTLCSVQMVFAGQLCLMSLGNGYRLHCGFAGVTAA